MQKHSPEVEVKSVVLRHVDWSGHTFHVERGATGKYTMTDLSNMDQDRLETMLREKKAALVLTHKSLADKLREPNSPLSHHSIIHWSQHRGTNDYSHHNKMYILSLWWLPAQEYSSKYLSEINKNSYKSGEYESLNLPNQSLTTEIKQAVGRINRNKEHNTVDIYIRLPKGKEGDYLIDSLSQEFTGATFEDKVWFGLESGSKSRKINELCETISSNFPKMDLGYPHPLNKLVREDYRRLLQNYRSRDKASWAKIGNLLKEKHGLACIRGKDSTKKIYMNGKKVIFNEWVIIKEK